MTATEHPIDREEVMAYLDGELPPARASLVVAHLERCVECRALATDLRDVSRGMAEWQVDPPPATLDRSVLGGDDAKPRVALQAHRVFSRPRVWRWPHWAITTGAAAAVTLFTVATSVQRSARSEYLGAPMAQGIAANSAERAPERSAEPSAIAAVQSVGLRLARTAVLNLMIDDVDRVRARLDQLVRERQGYVSDLAIEGDAASGRSLRMTLRVPAAQLDAALADFRTLGRVLEESQNAENVTEQHVDLQARLNNARTTEQRLNQIVQQRTGSVKDVLEAEQEIGRVRGEIERLDAQLRNLTSRVELATVQLRASEPARASLELSESPVSTRLRNAVIDGYRSAVRSVLGAALVLLRHGPVLLLWVAVLFWPARWLWRRVTA